MTNRFGYGLIATMATASIVLAGGEGEDKKGEKNKNTRTLERLANSPATQGATLKAAPGKGFTVDLGDDFSINIQNRVQVRWTYANMELAGDTNSFAMNRVRTQVGGHIWDKDTTYRVQLEYAMGSIIRDAWLRRNFWTSEDGNMNVALRVGQFRGRHGLEYEGSSFELEHAARSISSRTFSGTRVLGARLEGSALEGGKLNWGIAAVNDDPALASFIAEGGGNVHGAANPDNELNFLFDLRFDPMGAMDMSQGDLAHTEELMGTVGASVMVGNHRNGTPVDVESTSININTAWKYQGIYALAEVFLRSDDTSGGVESDHTGWNVQASYTMPKPDEGIQWGGGARISMIENSDPASQALVVTGLGALEGSVTEIGGTVNAYYHEHKLKTQIGYTFQQVDFDATAAGTDSDNHMIDILFQWVF